ncbi:MAG: GGDEF domain-containing protein [Thermoleophilaceae bacterium]
MSGTALSALARLAERRFPSFSEAADAVLDLLEGELPAGSILVGQVDWDGGEYRLIDVRGDVAGLLHPGSTLTLAGDADGNGLLDRETLSSLAVRSYLAIPLETSAGGGAITVCALAAGTDVYTRSHLELIAVAGRLLAYEWESVTWRADLRRLSERLRDPKKTDALTGLHNRTSFEEALEREWRLAERGSSDAFVVLLRLRNLGEVAERYGEGLKELLLKDAAEVLEGAMRRSDHAGRVADDTLGAVLVGCKGREGAEAFYGRFEQGLAQIARDRPAAPRLEHAIRALGECDSPERALQDAEEAIPA